jgi:hypothetical protein
MPRKKAEGNGGGNGGEQSTASDYAKAREEQEKNAIVGEETGKTLQQQADEARGEGDQGDKAKEMAEYTDGADKEAEKILEEAFPERKATNIRVEANQKFNEKFGIDPNAPSSRYKVEISDKGGKLYKGHLTLQSVHADTLEKIAFVVIDDPGSPAHGEEYLFHIMKSAHPQAMREHFEIDAENKTDPLLRSRYE